MKDVTNSSEAKHAKEDLFDRMKKKTSSGNWPSTKLRKLLYPILLLAIAIYYYIVLPPLHYAAYQFWLFIFLIVAGVVVVEFLADLTSLTTGEAEIGVFKVKSGKYKRLILPLLVLVLVGGASYLVLSPVFFAKSYASMLTYEQKDFNQDFPETDLSQIPLVDRDTAQRLGNRHLGALTDLVSQFQAAPDYTQITVDGQPYRVTPLEYAGFFRWLNNFRQGIPHYIQVDNVTGEVEIKTPSAPMKYSYSDLFQRDVLRKLRFAFPLTIFDRPSFEVDDQGHPYYVATTYGRHFFLWEPEPTGVITLDAVTGETQSYDLDHTPEWIDRVYGADLVMHQLEMNGHYKNGFWNSLLAKKGVTEPTAGYNYLPIGNDLYLYTGITSVNADESNIGFVLVNLRTKDAVMYPLTAAEEFSAMRSAEGSVQETSYQATFPLLINIQGKPYYILTLKDNSGLIKDYALVDAQNYQKVYVASSVERLLETFAEENNVKMDAQELAGDLSELQGEIDQIQATVVDGNSVYYFMMDGKIYRANLAVNPYLPFVTAGDQVEMKVTKDGAVRELSVDGVEASQQEALESLDGQAESAAPLDPNAALEEAAEGESAAEAE